MVFGHLSHLGQFQIKKKKISFNSRFFPTPIVPSSHRRSFFAGAQTGKHFESILTDYIVLGLKKCSLMGLYRFKTISVLFFINLCSRNFSLLNISSDSR